MASSPKLLVPLSGDWKQRLSGFLGGDADQACPEAVNPSGSDEFEKHDKAEKARAACDLRNRKAIGLLKQCPALLVAPADVQQYDFGDHDLPLELQPQMDMLTSDTHWIWWQRDFLLHWPGLLPDRLVPSRAAPEDTRCIGGWLSNGYGQSTTSIYLKFPPKKAKALKDKLAEDTDDKCSYTVDIQVAALFDGGAKKQAMACDAKTPKAGTAKVLAWRVLPHCGSHRTALVPWQTVATWTPPSSCTDAREFFGVEAPPSKTGREKAATKPGATKHQEIGPDHGFTLAVKAGEVDGLGMGAFQAKYLPASKGKTFQQAAAVCRKAGMVLCSSTQWARACHESDVLRAMPSWTASYTSNYSALQVRGGGTCADATSSRAAESSAERVGICCNMSIAWQKDTGVKTPGSMLLPIQTFQHALNSRDAKLLGTAFAPELTRYYTVENVSRTRAIKLSMDYMTNNPDFWAVTERCSFGGDDIRCLRNVFNGTKGEAVQSEYALSPDHTMLTYVRAPKIFRRMSPL